MTRKDYILIAAALKEARAQTPVTDNINHTFELLGNSTAARVIAHALAKDNPRFDRERFLEAAGTDT
jgi:hypothetical protein